MARQSVDRVALARRIGRAEAVVHERERLRPLLERCRLVINMILGRAERISEPELSQIEKLLAELGDDEPEDWPEGKV